MVTDNIPGFEPLGSFCGSPYSCPTALAELPRPGAMFQDQGMPEGLRLAEVLGALSLATDLGVGQPLEQALRTCLIALQIGERLGLNTEDLSDVYYVSLLRFLGCTAELMKPRSWPAGTTSP